jgi:hypothetical protein
MEAVVESNRGVERRFHGPHLGFVALAYTVLFLAGLYPVTMFGGMPWFPPPTATVAEMVTFFSQRPAGTMLCVFLQFGAMIPLGIFAATVSSQLQFLNVRAAGAWIAQYAGMAVSITGITGSSVLWAMTFPDVAQNPALLHALYGFAFGLGGPTFAVLFGLMVAGVSITAGFYRLLPRWLVVMGIAIAVAGQLSWIAILTLKALPLIPLTRFPGFVWMIAAGFLLPRKIAAKAAA